MLDIYKKLLLRVLYLLPLYFCIRIIFYFYNMNLYKSFTIGEVVMPLLYGLRFDLAGIILLNLPFILLSLLVINAERVKKYLFIVLNTVGLSFLIVDLEFFQFLGKKMTVDIFGLQGDIFDQSFQLVFYYWKLFLLFVIALILIIKFYPARKIDKLPLRKTFSLKHILCSFLVLIFSFFALRGGFQSRSIGPKEAFIFEKHILGNLALNPVYTILRSSFKKSEKVRSHFKDDSLAQKVIEEHISFDVKNFNHSKKQNVVILILESFSYEYIKEGFTPFLDSLKGKSLFFEAYAGGRRSIEALPSILLGLPSVAQVPISQSAFQGNKFLSFPHYLKDYDASFYHGGKNGTMGFDFFTKSIGIPSYFGRDEYPDQEHFDGTWGIFDHHYLNYFSRQLTAKHRPFISTLFTLSSHQPYKMPSGFEDRFDKGSLEIHESIGYADEALKLFFEQSSKEEWFKDTLFVITADHTQKLQSKEYNHLMGSFRVPIIFYHPRLNLSEYQKERVVSHADILPSVLDFLDQDHSKKIALGNSVFSNSKGVFFTRLNGEFLLKENNKELKRALEQYFINGLIKNDIYR